MEYDVKKRKLIGSCIILSLISLMFTLVQSDAIIPNKSLARSESTQYEQKIEWNQTFGGTGEDAAYALIQTIDGGFALVGVTESHGAGRFDIWLIKIDANGVAQWNQTFGGTENDGAYSAIQTTDGGFALAGLTRSYGTGEFDMWLVKTDAHGVAQWNKTFGGADFDHAYALIETTDGGFTLVGSTRSYGAGEFDMWLVKTDAHGVAQWNQTYGGTEWDNAYALIQTTDGGVALAGSTRSYGAGESDMWLIKIDAHGVTQWNQTYGGTGDESTSALIQTTDGGFALAGNTRSYGAEEYDIWLVKTDTNGVAQWNKAYGGTERDAAYSIIQTSDEGFGLAGFTGSYGAGHADMWFIKIKPTSTLEALLAPLLNFNLIGFIFFFITLFLLIITIKKQKRG